MQFAYLPVIVFFCLLQAPFRTAVLSSLLSFDWILPENTPKNGSYNPDMDLSAIEIVARHGYHAESYVVTTDDGYLLNMHRIPCGKDNCNDPGQRGSGPPVFLQHGLLMSSTDWIISGPGKGLAFILADAGYDVWLGNARGNTYSRRHVNFRNTEDAYWDFSFAEMALYDLPAEIDFIYKKKSKGDAQQNNLIIIGHSMGTTMVFAMLSERPEYNAKIKGLFALAPVAYMSNVKSPLTNLAKMSTDFKFIGSVYGKQDFLPQSGLIRKLSNFGCDQQGAEGFMCENTVFLFSGFEKTQYNASLMPVILSHTPAGSSTKTMVHYAQEIANDGKFQKFDYGQEENRKKYGQNKPPLYNLKNIKIPVSLIYAENDLFAGPEDVKLLFNSLQHTIVRISKVPIEKFSHIDFMWGVDTPKLVYTPLLEAVKSFSPVKTQSWRDKISDMFGKSRSERTEIL